MTESKHAKPILVAHRGESARYPENTLLALEEALKLGCLHVEFDVQLSRDEVPMVIHDKQLQRTTGVKRSLFDLTASEAKRISAGYERRFGEAYLTQKLPSLLEVVDLLSAWPKARAFVELKRASIQHFGQETMLDAVMQAIVGIKPQCVIISYQHEILHKAREKYAMPIGWVFDKWSAGARRQAYELLPEYLFSDVGEFKLSKQTLWPGDWSWALFEVNDPVEALYWASKGVSFIETNDIQAFKRHADFTDQLNG